MADPTSLCDSVPAASSSSYTTSDFHKNALQYARTAQKKIILINGQRLAELMIEHGVGVSTVRTIAIKRVDSDYFEDA